MLNKVLKKDKEKIKGIINTPDWEYDHESPEYLRSKDFNKAWKLMMKHIFPAPDYEIVYGGCYCEASGFIKNKEGKYIYFSSEDYRWPIMGRDIFSSVLYRTSPEGQSYRNHGYNDTCNIDSLKEKVDELFKRM